MKKHLLALCLGATSFLPLSAESVTVKSPDTRLSVTLDCPQAGHLTYQVSCNGKNMTEASPLGLVTNIADFTQGISWIGHKCDTVTDSYDNPKIKQSHTDYKATRLIASLKNRKGDLLDIEFQVSNGAVAFRYLLPKQGETGSVRVLRENTGFSFPEVTTTFLCPQSDAMIGWKRTKPSYEEVYRHEAPMNERSQYGHGYTFPCLFHVGDNGWVLVSETGVDSRYCASHLSDCQDGTYTIAFPMPEENNGNGTVEPAFSLPGATPWRTLSVGETLKPIVESTIAYDVVKPLYETQNKYCFGRSTWSWIVWQDNSMNWKDQVTFIDLAADMGYEYILIDAGWDKTPSIGYEKMPDLIRYAHSKNVDVFLWYSSSGYWNDIVQSPTNKMDNSIIRKREMKWLKQNGVKGIKVDFFGGDKQETMRLYEEILSDADDHGLMVIFHGCTLPRGWERMYPNYVGSEAVLASENMVFGQYHCDEEARNACLHPFIRNAVGCMEYGGTFLNHRLDRSNQRGKVRKTTDVFQLANTILYQNPIQNFALTPNNLTNEAQKVCIDYMRQVPTTWDETRFIDGYPGKYIVLARRHGEKWYIAAVNATTEPLRLNLTLPMLAGTTVDLYTGGNNAVITPLKVKNKGVVKLTLQPNDGAVIVKEMAKSL